MPLYLQAPQGMLAASLKHPIDCAEQATPVTASESTYRLAVAADLPYGSKSWHD